jgi:HSP20 family protein
MEMVDEDDKRKKKRKEREDGEPDELGPFEDGLFGWPSDRRRRSMDPFFSDMDSEFERMRRYMDHMMQAAMRGDLSRDDPNKPFIYGFSMKTGPDGKPVFREFGNTRRAKRITGTGPRATCPAGTCTGTDDDHVTINGREPLTDVIDCGDTIAVTVELPGVEKKDIQLNVSEETLTIQVDTEERRYYKEVDLQAPVEEDTTKASYKNGVLDVTLKKKAVEKKKGKRVEIQ